MLGIRSRYSADTSGEGRPMGRKTKVHARYRDQPRAAVAILTLAEADRPNELLLKDLYGQIEERRTFDPEPEPEPSGSGQAVIPNDKNYLERFPIVRRTEHEATMMVQGDLAHQPWLVQMARMIMDELDYPELQKLIVDMSGVTDFNVQSVAWSVGLERFVRDRERTLAIVNASPVVHRVLERMGIDG